jgi:hypothetical protein
VEGVPGVWTFSQLHRPPSRECEVWRNYPELNLTRGKPLEHKHQAVLFDNPHDPSRPTNHATKASFNADTRPLPARIAMRFTSLVFGAAALVATAAAHSIHLNPHARECFHENLHREDRMTVSYQVGDREFGSAGNLEIDFWVRLTWQLLLPCP